MCARRTGVASAFTALIRHAQSTYVPQFSVFFVQRLCKLAVGVTYAYEHSGIDFCHSFLTSFTYLPAYFLAMSSGQRRRLLFTTSMLVVAGMRSASIAFLASCLLLGLVTAQNQARGPITGPDQSPNVAFNANNAPQVGSSGGWREGRATFYDAPDYFQQVGAVTLQARFYRCLDSSCDRCQAFCASSLSTYRRSLLEDLELLAQ